MGCSGRETAGRSNGLWVLPSDPARHSSGGSTRATAGRVLQQTAVANRSAPGNHRSRCARTACKQGGQGSQSRLTADQHASSLGPGCQPRVHRLPAAVQGAWESPPPPALRRALRRLTTVERRLLRAAVGLATCGEHQEGAGQGLGAPPAWVGALAGHRGGRAPWLGQPRPWRPARALPGPLGVSRGRRPPLQVPPAAGRVH